MSLKSKVSNNDTAGKHLDEKIVAGTNVTITVLDEGGDEQLEISATGGGGGADADAIHDNVAGEIHAITNKAVPEGADELVAETSTAGAWTKVRMSLTNIFANITAALSSATNALKSATTTVNTSSATAPTSGQALIATGGSAATWQNLAGKDTTAVHSGDVPTGDLGGTYPNPTVTQSRGLKSASTTVAVDSATAPTVGQVLTATSTTAARWQTPAAAASYYDPLDSEVLDHFTSDTSASWTFTPTKSASAIAPRTTITTNPRVSFAGIRPSHLAFQPADATNCYMTQAITLANGDFVWARGCASQQTGSASSTVQNFIGLYLSENADPTTGHTLSLILQAWSSVTSTLTCSFNKNDSAGSALVGNRYSSLTDSIAGPQYIGIHRVSSTVYDGWMFNDNGQWIHLGTYTKGGGDTLNTLDNVGFRMFDDGGTPGSRVTFIDFVARRNTTVVPF